MPNTLFHGRRAVALENESLRLTVLEEGGHIGEVFSKQAGVSPLWVPQWTSVEPSEWTPAKYPAFGSGCDAKLLVGIMGHNLCLDLFGGPSAEEEAAGMTAHGEGSVNRYSITEESGKLTMSLHMPLAELQFTRTLELRGEDIRIEETVENLTAADRPLAWTQHVTLSPPFLRPETTEFRASMKRSVVAEVDPGAAMYLVPGAEFTWPTAPRSDGGTSDLQKMNPTAPASGYTASLADPASDNAFWIAYSPEYKLAFSYIWKHADFPWLGIWEENCSRLGSPWNGTAITRGMEFGASPFPETRREMVDRSKVLGHPSYRWLPAKGKLQAEYWISTRSVDAIPESVAWPG